MIIECGRRAAAAAAAATQPRYSLNAGDVRTWLSKGLEKKQLFASPGERMSAKAVKRGGNEVWLTK